MSFCLSLAFNGTSLGSASFAIAREIYKRGLSPVIWPIGGGVDFSAQKEDRDFSLWLESNINRAPKYHKRDSVCFRIWHLSQGMESYSKKSALYFFHETDSPTDEEINVVNQNDLAFTSSKYIKKTFEDYGVNKNVIYCPLGFDSHNFHKITNKEYLGKDVIVFSLIGKMENRKNTLRIINLWSKKFGNDRRYRLHCLIYNNFLPPEQQEQQIFNALEGKRYHNIQFYGWLKSNAEVNDMMNATNIDLSGLSGGEGWNLGLFNSLCLGKWAVAMNGHSQKDYVSDKNCILVNPTSMRPAEDGIFFQRGGKFNQGNWFDVGNDEIVAAMELALKKAHTPNPEGEKLKEEFSYQKTVNIIVDNLK